MRTGPDRIRHAIGFEVIGLLLCIPLASWATGSSLAHMGVVGIAISMVATAWNYLYNIWVDKLMLSWLGRLDKTYAERILHAVCFELGLLLLTLPVIAHALAISLAEALLLDIGFVIFYVIYAFFYNLAYDRWFPVQVMPRS